MRVDPTELAQWKSALTRAQTQRVRWWERLYRRLRPGPLRVFLSYKSQARADATRLAARLSKVRGVHVWQDVDELRAGDKWSLRLAQEAARADVMVCWLDPGYFTSEWTAFEVGILTGTHARIGDHPTARLMPVWSGERLPADVCPDVFASSQSLASAQGVDAALDAAADALTELQGQNRRWRRRAQLAFWCTTMGVVVSLTLLGVGLGSAAACRANAGALANACASVWSLDVAGQRALGRCGAREAPCATVLDDVPNDAQRSALELGCGTHDWPSDCAALFGRDDLKDEAGNLHQQWKWYWHWHSIDPLGSRSGTPPWLSGRAWPAPGTAAFWLAYKCGLGACSQDQLTQLAQGQDAGAQLVRDQCTRDAGAPLEGSPTLACAAWFQVEPDNPIARQSFCQAQPEDPACTCAVQVRVIPLPFAARDSRCDLQYGPDSKSWSEPIDQVLRIGSTGTVRATVAVNTTSGSVSVRDDHGTLLLEQRSAGHHRGGLASPCSETRRRAAALLEALVQSGDLPKALPTCAELEGACRPDLEDCP